MHIYTLIQLFGLAVLWAVKSSEISLVFPFFVVAMVPLRMVLRFIYTPMELEAVSELLIGGFRPDGSMKSPSRLPSSKSRQTGNFMRPSGFFS
jgi:hypothetical protein